MLGNDNYKLVCMLDHKAMLTVQTEKYGVFDCKPLQFIWAKVRLFCVTGCQPRRPASGGAGECAPAGTHPFVTSAVLSAAIEHMPARAVAAAGSSWRPRVPTCWHCCGVALLTWVLLLCCRLLS